MYTAPVDLCQIPQLIADVKQRLRSFQFFADQPQEFRFRELLKLLTNVQAEMKHMSKNPRQLNLDRLRAGVQTEWKTYCSFIKYDTHFSQRQLTTENISTLMSKIKGEPIPLIEHLQRVQQKLSSEILGFKSARQYPRAQNDYSIAVTKEDGLTRYWLMTSLCVAKATNRGIVKVAFQISSENHKVSIDFSKPYGCKIQYLPPGYKNNPAFFKISKIMYDEASFLSRLDRDNQVLKEYTMMTLYPGYALNQLIREFVAPIPLLSILTFRKKTLNLKQKTLICLGIAEEVKKFHKAGLINLDMKADNVIINPHPTDPYHFSIRLIDADNTKTTGDDLSKCTGTACFQPPEIRALAPGKPSIQANASANIYTLGKIFIEIFLGYPIDYEWIRPDTFREWRDDYTSIYPKARSPLVAMGLRISYMMKEAAERPTLDEVIETLNTINLLFIELPSIMLPPVKCPEKPIPTGEVLVISRPAEAMVYPAPRSPSPTRFEERAPLLGKGKETSAGCCVIS